MNPPLFIASESSYAITDNELYHAFNVAITIHLGNPGLGERYELGDIEDRATAILFNNLETPQSNTFVYSEILTQFGLIDDRYRIEMDEIERRHFEPIVEELKNALLAKGIPEVPGMEETGTISPSVQANIIEASLAILIKRNRD